MVIHFSSNLSNWERGMSRSIGGTYGISACITSSVVSASPALLGPASTALVSFGTEGPPLSSLLT